MRAVTWQGYHDMQVAEVPDPRLQEPTDIIVEVTSTAICGSDLHLYGPLSPFMTPGDIVGHEFMGTVAEVGAGVTQLSPGDRVVVPFTIACGACFMCRRGLQSQCETTQVRAEGTGAALFGYTRLYGRVPGGQAEYVRVPHADYGPIKVPATGADDRWLFLSDILPTAWQAVSYADLPPEGTLVVVGLGPVGQLCVASAFRRGAAQVIGIDLVPERLNRAARLGAVTLDADDEQLAARVRDLTDGRGADSVIDAVGMEAHGSPVAAAATTVVSRLPRRVAAGISYRAGVDRLAAFQTAASLVRRGGTLSLIGVYGGAADPVNLRELFDRQITLRMGQANVRRWTDVLRDVLSEDADVFGVDTLASHHLPLEEAPQAYQLFHARDDGCLKVVLHP